MPMAYGAIAHAATGSWKEGELDGKQTTDDLSRVPRYGAAAEARIVDVGRVCRCACVWFGGR